MTESILSKFLEKILNAIMNLTALVSGLAIQQAPAEFVIYTNKSLQVKLGISDRLLRQYLDNGLLDHVRVGDKIWITQKQLDLFIERHTRKAYAFSNDFEISEADRLPKNKK